MMTWLTPIGFLGLIGLIVLIIIYIIKPNYQNKVISSTFIWRLSLKYRKKRLPINKLQNILQFLCQLLILTISALLLAQPVISSMQFGDENEKIIIIDASASMRVNDGNRMRFEKAVDRAKEVAQETIENGGIVSIVLADADPNFVVQRCGEAQLQDVTEKLDELLADGTQCIYGSADMQGAVSLAEEVLRYNSEAQVHLYTATNYIEKNGIIVENFSTESEWNAAILGVDAYLDQSNHVEVDIRVGCYGRTEYLTVYCTIHKPNGNEQPIQLQKTEAFDPTEEERTIVFNDDHMRDQLGGRSLTSYDYMEVYVTVSDSLQDDNSFFVYGGQKQVIRIQYASSKPNVFVNNMIRSMRQTMKNDWKIEFVELEAGATGATEGFDFYIFEHKMPSVMPTDGIVLLINPGSAPENSGLNLGELKATPDPRSTYMAAGNPHDLMNFVDPGRITLYRYREILSSDGYQELAYYNGSPLILAKNDDQAKVVVWAFDLHYTNLATMPDFSFMMFNMFNYFIPTTMDANYYEIGETVNLQARGTQLSVQGEGIDMAFEGKTGKMVISKPGSYTVTQMPMKGDTPIVEQFFVSIPNYESNISKNVDALPIINVDRNMEIELQDLLFYFAIGLVLFMFAEWYLNTKKNY